MPTIRAPNTWDTFINGMWETGTNYPTISTPQEGLGSDGRGDMTPSQTKVLRVKVYCPKCEHEVIEIDYGRIYKCEKCGFEKRKYPKSRTLQEALNALWEVKDAKHDLAR